MAGLPAEKRGGFTWDDYQTWPDDQRWEIIGGEAFNMSPAPLVRHQIVSRELEHRVVKEGHPPYAVKKQVEQ